MTDSGIIEVTVGRALPGNLALRLSEAVPAGALLRIRGGDLKVTMALQIASVRAGGRELPIVHRYSGEEQARDWSFYTSTFSMAVVRTEADLPAGTPLELEISEARPSIFSGITWTISAGLTEDPHSPVFRRISDEAAISFTADKADHIEGYLRPSGAVFVEQFDAFGNPAESDGASLTVVAGTCRAEAEPVAGLAATRVELPTEASDALRARVSDAAGRSATTNARPVTEDGSNIYFGDLHWHCHVSCDGQRELAEALKSARDELCLDFAAAADHMGCDGRYYTPLTTRYQADVCGGFDRPGGFCTIPGAELGGRGGHANVYCDSFETFLALTDRFEAELRPRFLTDLFNFQALSDLLPAGGAVVVPHHTSANSGGVCGPDGRPLWNAMHFPMPADRKVVRLLEIVQSGGAYESERIDEEWRTRKGGLGGSAQTALLRGYRLGFVGGTDNHCGWPARGGAGEPVGLTAVLAEQLDTKSIFEALHARRCYATSGARITADVTCNGLPMGSELKLAVARRPEFHIRIHGTCPLTHVQIIHVGCVLADLTVAKGSQDFEAEWADDRPGRPVDDAYYYIRARQEDGHCVWTSPFWIDLEE